MIVSDIVDVNDNLILVNNIEEFNENWEVPAGDSWHSRFFN